jgi:hypothetical protein
MNHMGVQAVAHGFYKCGMCGMCEMFMPLSPINNQFKENEILSHRVQNIPHIPHIPHPSLSPTAHSVIEFTAQCLCSLRLSLENAVRTRKYRKMADIAAAFLRLSTPATELP